MTLLYLAITIKLAPELRIFIFYMMELLSSPETWVALLTLTILEIVLGIDNIVFISIISDKLPKEKQKRARKTGLALALITRILLLLSLSWVMSLTDPLFNVLSNDISGRDLILLIGGLFLIYKATTEIHEKIEGHEEVTHKTKGNISFAAVIFQILLLDIIFSLDSVITAVGMANHIEVRKALHEKGIHIPEQTWFVGALHDTAADQIKFYDTDKIPAILNEKHKLFSGQFETALDLNAQERSRRFASINTKANLKQIRKEIKNRSVSLFEPRPELGHGSNALCIIGRRAITKNIFLDRRAFLNSYDYTIDPTGDLLVRVISPIGPVCGGINLEYYFSRIDNQKLGAGTKLPHNVMGLIGVSNSSDGDLRPGLPLQMIEVHDPVRLLVVVEQVPDIVLKVVKSSENIYNWYSKQWIHLVVINPIDGNLYQFKNDQFEPYETVSIKTEKVQNFQQLFENATEMSAFTIENATTENLPIYYLN